jgi:hypothetical protein
MKRQQNIPSAALSVFTYDDAIQFVSRRTKADSYHERQVMQEIYPDVEPTSNRIIHWRRIAAVVAFISWALMIII